MARDVNRYLSSQQAKASNNDIAREWAILEELYTKRLWHQVTLKVQELVKSSYLQEGTALIDLYENFLAEIENKINPLSLVEIIIFVVKKITDYDKCLDFLSKTKEKVKENTMAVILCNIIIGQIKLNHGDLEGVKKLVEETEEMIESLDGITTVHGRFYQLCSDYHRVKKNYACYYRDALRFLGCTELETIPCLQSSKANTLSAWSFGNEILIYKWLAVELLVMKALSLGLVKGSIDGVDKKVHMHWVQPRVLDKQQIASMKQQLERWCREVKSTENLLQAEARDILT
ncbi:26S proteasome non-ATPase regulatory subunit 13-like [Centruroides sculpturatus]|uniref:26S proteasome non-ATPase regulatory subunit 13-like n=1 Tax=Centruroides sculpturatus TaxID=218467 RepID=UPI000C6D2711|nr:26S proteasome non-ATPase regulatory subunit 13-like [Centruroides sculpturatus]